ncbi:hypothetical protein P389DRAFT_193621 [Cystobasidium minutum MCA 4210]|uniref:uncharacterized protein n=1 Tax=Cystobasidium minutum MCA 4210 TaxID=1397322 RepID=UPI0034D00A44|eukprot:jgi/Rhomi1/193621/gm1.1835_g
MSDKVDMAAADAATSQAALIKLGFFTVAMVLGPIGTYFLSLKHVWGESNTTSAAVSAALVANLVVFAYIITALREDAAVGKTVKKD